MQTSNRFAYLVVVAFALPSVASARPAVPQNAAKVSSDTQTQADVEHGLGGRQFADVKVQVSNGVVELTGTVPLLADKLEAGRRAERRKGSDSVNNQIQVATGEVSDETLMKNLTKKLTYVREGYGSLTFDAFNVQVKNGVVTLGGFAAYSVDLDDAINDVTTMRGVRDLITKVLLAPLSPNDDLIRREEERAIYGFAMLNKYAVDPARPIRILVSNGRVVLVGNVASQSEKDAAGLRANTVFGVVQVTNDLRADNGPEK